MAPKIPSSLKWLIDKCARLDAEIKKTRASLSSAKQLIEELSKLEDDLAAIDPPPLSTTLQSSSAASSGHRST